MKNYFALAAALTIGLAMTSCHSKESAYKKAYEQAQAKQTAEQYTQQYTTQQYTTQPVQTTQVQTQQTTDYSNVAVRQETVSLVSGAGLRAYSVVVGSFTMLQNAEGLQGTLKGQGMAAQIVQSNINGKPWYRVVATTHDTKADAAQSRARLTATYPDAWLLYQK